MAEREVARHLHACAATLYHHLGDAAPSFTNDVYAVCAYEVARHFGDLAFAWRGVLDDEAPRELELVDAVLARARRDATGATSLYALALVVGPRLLVSVRDALDVLDAPTFSGLATRSADVTLWAMRRVEGAFARALPDVDEAWRDEARTLSDAFDVGGMAESLGLGA